MSNPFLVLWFSPNCGLFTNLQVTHSQALAHQDVGRLMPRALEKRSRSPSSPCTTAESQGALMQSLESFAH